MQRRGYCGIGIWHTKNPLNVGTLWRSADLLGASFVFTVGRRYERQASDTMKSWRHTPLFHFKDVDDLRAHLPYSCPLIGIEMADGATPLTSFAHPERAVYLLGAEDTGLNAAAIAACHHLVVLPGRRSMNVAVAGSVVLYDRVAKRGSEAA